VRILPREPKDRYAPLAGSAMDRRIVDELVTRLGSGTLMASSVNGDEGLWIGFKIDRDDYWMLLDRTKFSQVGGRTWLVWLITAAAPSPARAAGDARPVHPPPMKHF